LAVCGQAFAADIPRKMPTKAPVAAARAFSWTGCYVGGHVGAGWGSADFSDASPATNLDRFAPPGATIAVDQPARVLGGVQIGCDQQFADNWVVGLAGDFSWASIDGQATDPFFTGKSGGMITLKARTEWLATLTARVGYAFDRTLIYVKGGAAWAEHRYSINNLELTTGGNFCQTSTGVPCNPSATSSRTGWTIGAGVAWAFNNNWSVGVEYNHYDFGSHVETLSDPNGVAGPAIMRANIKQQNDAVKFTVDYRFAPGF
jgi:outer membrane immunogenic protein